MHLAKQLSPVDKVPLIQELTPDIQRELVSNQITPCKSLWGICADLGQAPSADEIDEASWEEWANFPREDI